MQNFSRAQCNGKAAAKYLLLVLASMLAFAASAHDFWIEPSTFRPKTGERVALRLLIGQEFKGEPALYVPDQFERYVFLDPAGATRKVEGKLGDDPAGTVSTAAPGTYVVGYYSKKFTVTFDSISEFEKYLVTEGLERNLPLAKRRASLRSGIVEVYTRCAKSLLLTAGASAKELDRSLGFPLELIAESNPYAGERKLRMRLLYQGKPLEGARITAMNKQRPTEKLKAQTDKDGRVTFDLSLPGTWLIASVHMIPANLLSRADWESFWASLTFELPK